MAENTAANSNNNNNANPPAPTEAATATTVTEEKSTKPAEAEANNNSEKKATMTTEKAEKAAVGLAFPAKRFSGILSILSFIISLPVLASVIWLLYMRAYDCESLLRLPKLQIGIGIGLLFMFILSTAALFLMRSRNPMVGFLLAFVPLLVMLTVGLALLGAYDMENRKILGSPRWLRMKIYDDNNWNNIKTCIYDSGACDDLFSRTLTTKSYDFSMKKLSPIEAGCCKPPEVCGMEFVNATYWRKENRVQKKSENPNDLDCHTWKNNRTILCYSCHTCKEGFLRTLKGKWWKLGLFLVLMALFLIISHLLLFIAAMLERLVG